MARSTLAEPKVTDPADARYSVLEPGQTVVAKPVFDHVRVVYLGPERNHNVALVGSVVEESYEVAPGEKVVTRSITDENIQKYLWETHDVAGRLITQNEVPQDSGLPGYLRGRPWIPIRHPDHLIHFFQATDERGENLYRLIWRNAADENRFVEYMRIARLRRGAQEAFVKDTID